jgi:asparagine synthase (glutamine-hydrolysing)
MCGITGTHLYNGILPSSSSQVELAVAAMRLRGPDLQKVATMGNAVLGHARLSIIDLSTAASQPFTDPTGRYTLVFNGEFFNFQEHRQRLANGGYPFRSHSDTEVILALYAEMGLECLNLINGFFAFAIYDKMLDTLVIARDRFGIKPLLYHVDKNRLVFASEMKAMLKYDISKKLNQSAMYGYFVHNYIPGFESIITDIKKLPPGHVLVSEKGNITVQPWYQLPNAGTLSPNYNEACKTLDSLLDDAVKLRLISDVPLGCFLSGGIDSSVIAAVATRHKPDLMTFNIGFSDQPFFDETHWAKMAAKHLKTNHQTIDVTNRDLLDILPSVLDYLDEPFADSSAILVNILSRETRKKVTVALSGDGADELFAGYRKHLAHSKAIEWQKYRFLAKLANPVLRTLPQTRSSSFGDKIRQWAKFSDGLSLSPAERYIQWASISSGKEVTRLLGSEFEKSGYSKYIDQITSGIARNESIGEITKADLQMVLHGDMLPKVDLMSMANSLEVRPPFLDFRLVEYVLSLPDSYKVWGQTRKRILQDTYRDQLPGELFTRPKKGFEVPLTSWMRGEMFHTIDKELLNKQYVVEQGLFNPQVTEKLKKQLFSPNVGDTPAKLWALIVFQHWYKKYFEA